MTVPASVLLYDVHPAAVYVGRDVEASFEPLACCYRCRRRVLSCIIYGAVSTWDA